MQLLSRKLNNNLKSSRIFNKLKLKDYKTLKLTTSLKLYIIAEIEDLNLNSLRNLFFISILSSFVILNLNVLINKDFMQS